jgi:succinate dehydrogenase/fumarate reductase cytochrome b subunit
MSVQRIVGIILLAGGVVLIILGVTASRSFGNQMSNFFTGHLTENTLWYLIGGIVAAVVGLVMLLGRFGRR